MGNKTTAARAFDLVQRVLLAARPQEWLAASQIDERVAGLRPDGGPPSFGQVLGALQTMRRLDHLEVIAPDGSTPSLYRLNEGARTAREQRSVEISESARKIGEAAAAKLEESVKMSDLDVWNARLHDRGISMATICGTLGSHGLRAAAMEFTGGAWSAPLDASDVGRCIRLLDAMEEAGHPWRKSLHGLETAGSTCWPALVRELPGCSGASLWTLIEKAYRSEEFDRVNRYLSADPFAHVSEMEDLARLAGWEGRGQRTDGGFEWFQPGGGSRVVGRFSGSLEWVHRGTGFGFGDAGYQRCLRAALVTHGLLPLKLKKGQPIAPDQQMTDQNFLPGQHEIKVVAVPDPKQDLIDKIALVIGMVPNDPSDKPTEAAVLNAIRLQREDWVRQKAIADELRLWLIKR